MHVQVTFVFYCSTDSPAVCLDVYFSFTQFTSTVMPYLCSQVSNFSGLCPKSRDTTVSFYSSQIIIYRWKWDTQLMSNFLHPYCKMSQFYTCYCNFIAAVRIKPQAICDVIKPINFDADMFMLSCMYYLNITWHLYFTITLSTASQMFRWVVTFTKQSSCRLPQSVTAFISNISFLGTV